MGKTTSITPRSFWLTILAFTIIVNLTMTRMTYLRLLELKADLTRSTWSGVLIFCLLLVAACLWMMIRIARDEKFAARFDRLHLNNSTWRVLGGIIFLVILIMIPYIKFKLQIGQEVKTPIYDPNLLLWSYYWMCWWLILLAMTALKLAFDITWLGGFASATLLFGVVFEIMIRYNVVTDYPFSLGWSEGSRYYYASLFYSKQIYGETFPFSTLHPTRYLLQSFPFLFPGLGIYVQRLWQFLLWIILTAAASLALTKRVFPNTEKAIRWLATCWLFLFTLRVGVYYHLEVMVILPLLFVSGKKLWESLIAVIIASIWAGMSRVNWFPMPAMIAIAIYLLETPVHSSIAEKPSLKQIVRYLIQPAFWTVAGLTSALLSQVAYISISGNSNNIEAFTSSFTSDLLWYRLWPNENFPLGIIPAILIISGPLIAVIILAARRWTSLHPIRWLGLITMLVALFAGSAVVSVKIGGGGDLHNMDTYAALIGIVGIYFVSGRVQSESGEILASIRPTSVIVVAAIIPLLVLIPMLSPYPQYNKDVNEAAHQQLIAIVNETGKHWPILFINDRQVIALGEVDVPLVYDYEVVTLMEMAMSGNQVYLNNFYNDLANHRFAAIIATKQNTIIKQDGIFAEENNVWNTYVSPYILCYYESNLTIEADGTRLEVYVPRTQSGDCPSRSQIP